MMELLHFENRDRIIADVCDERIELKLVISSGEEIVLYDDTLLSMVSLYTNYFLDTKKMELAPGLRNVNLGKLLNIYYYRIANGMDLDEMVFHSDPSDPYGYWIGTTYCCFENNHIATWIYFTNGRCVFKCTPLYEGLWDDYDVINFKEFIKNYKEYKNEFSCHKYRKFMDRLKSMILV